jgi:hypothetical protein
VVLLVMSLRLTRATQGLSLALFVALVLRSVSEVPLLMFGYSTEMFIHVLLLMVLAAALRSEPTRAAQAVPASSRSFGSAMATARTMA